VKDRRKVFSIVGPKGGVGKSTISANLAISLARMGKKVIIADLDLGGANLHAIFGIRNYSYSLDDFILKKVKNLADVVIDTDVNNLKFICGGSQIPDAANIPFQQKVKLISHLSKLETDILIMDLAAGSSYNVVDFLFAAHKVFIVTTPEVTSLMNLYSFIKSAVFRRLTFNFKAEKSFKLLDLLEKAKDPDANPHLNTIEKFFNEAEKIDSRSVGSAKKIIEEFSPYIVINRAQTPSDSNGGKVLQGLMRKYMSIESNVLSIIPEDKAVIISIKKMKPIIIENPQSDFSRAIMELSMKIATMNQI